MKASKIILGFFVAQIICLGVPQMAFGQAEKLGIVQYTPPKGWNKTSKDNMVAFSNPNQTTGGLGGGFDGAKAFLVLEDCTVP